MVQPTSQMPMTGQQGDGRIVGVGEWMLMMLVMYIPIVNIIMLFVWAFGNDGSATKSNFFKAALIWALIGTVIGIIVSVAFGATIAALMSQGGASAPTPPPGF